MQQTIDFPSQINSLFLELVRLECASFGYKNYGANKKPDQTGCRIDYWLIEVFMSLQKVCYQIPSPSQHPSQAPKCSNRLINQLY